MPPRNNASSELVLRLATGHIVSAALNVAIALGIPALLASGPRTLKDLAANTGACPDALRRVLRVLIHVGILREDRVRMYELTSAASSLVDEAGNVRSLARWLSHPLHARALSNLEAVVRRRDGEGRSPISPDLLFASLDSNGELAALFHDAMAAATATSVSALLKAFSFERFRTIVDVGGGIGDLLLAILGACPTSQGILVDLPKPITRAEKLGAAMGSRFSAISSDFFTHVPPNGDLYILKNVLHDWPDDSARLILTNVRRNIQACTDARLLIIENITTDGRESLSIALMDLSLMMLTNGRERDADQYERLLHDTGFSLLRIISTASSLSILEASAA